MTYDTAWGCGMEYEEASMRTVRASVKSTSEQAKQLAARWKAGPLGSLALKCVASGKSFNLADFAGKVCILLYATW